MDETPGREIKDRDIRGLVKKAAAQDGWRYDDGSDRGGHPMPYPADRTQRPFSIPTTPSDHRSIGNLRAQIVAPVARSEGKGTTMDYSVHLEARDPAGSGLDDWAPINHFADFFERHAGVVAGGPGHDSVAVQFSLLARTPAEAAVDAEQLWDKANIDLDLHWPLVRLEVVAGDVLDEDLEQPLHPELWGVAEVAEHLGVSKQRVAQIREDLDFPAPHVQLAAGPVWLAERVRQWEETWARRPGRPKASADDLRTDPN